MRLKLFVICCILQSIQGFDIYDTNTTSLTPDQLQNIIDTMDDSNYIAGGAVAPKGLFPYQCSLQIAREPWCGCAIIDSKFVLTASHCIVGYSEKQVRIMVGSNDLRSGNGTYYDVERLIPHEQYNRPKGAYDIALVKVMGTIQFNKNVTAIQLEDENVPDDADVLLTGWGRVKENYIPNQLQYVRLVVLNKDACKKAPFGDYVQDHHVCTDGRIGIGACQGDSGGALTHDNKLLGVVNFGIPCGVGIPDVYAKVSFFKQWITNHTIISN